MCNNNTVKMYKNIKGYLKNLKHNKLLSKY